MHFAHGQTVTLLRGSPAGTDKYGDPAATSAARIEVADCALAPRYSTEGATHGRGGVVVGFSLFAPLGSDIRHTDEVELPGYPGVRFAVEGTPANWQSPFSGWGAGLEVSLRRAEG